MVHTGSMVTAHKSPELAAQEDLQNAISQHRDAIQLALRRYTILLGLPSTPCLHSSKLFLNSNGQLEHVLRQTLSVSVCLTVCLLQGA